MREPTIPINGGEAQMRLDVAERHGIKPNDVLDWQRLMLLREEEYEARKKDHR